VLAAAEEADADALAAIEAVCVPGGWDARAFGRALRHSTTRALVLWWLPPAARALEIAAYCLTTLVVDEAQILSFGVAPVVRRQGLGALLLDRSLRMLAQQGARSAHLEVRPSNEAALRLYAAAGFHEVGRRRGYYREPPEDAVVMANLHVSTHE